jgi:hypothetical protein
MEEVIHVLNELSDSLSIPVVSTLILGYSEGIMYSK